MEPAQERIVSLQVLRFLAASSVMWIHTIQNVTGQWHHGAASDFGPMGVDVFFVLSGFIIARVAPGRAPWAFLSRRLIRILPLYYLLLAFEILVLVLSGRFTTAPLASSLFLVPEPGVRQYLNTSWTLDYEMLFYAATSLVLLSPRLGVRLALALYGIALATNAAIGGPVFTFIGNPLITEFLAGAVIAQVAWTQRRAAVAAGLAILGLAAVWRFGFEGEDLWLRIPLYGVPAAAIVYAASGLRIDGLIWARLAYLGDASYAAYLVHQTPLQIVYAFHRLLPPIAGTVIVFAGCWVLAILVHEGADKPIRAMLTARSRRLAPA
jgi:exopolysaccharide production protein ExoZ